MRLPRAVARIARWSRCRGFGVQSPFAYHFVREVVREHRPHEGYARLASQFVEEGGRSRALHQFYLRLSARLQAGEWLANAPSEAASAYIEAGCGGARVVCRSSHPDVVMVTPVAGCEDFLRQTLPLMGERTVLVVEDVGRNVVAARMWRRVVDDARSTATFDIYDCGVAFFDHRLVAKHYKVMLPVPS